MKRKIRKNNLGRGNEAKCSKTWYKLRRYRPEIVNALLRDYSLEFPSATMRCWRQLGLLLWKSVYLYKLRRNWLVTGLEVFFPLLLTIIQAYLHCYRLPYVEDVNATTTTTPAPFPGRDPNAPRTVRPGFLFPGTIAFVPAPGPGACERSLARLLLLSEISKSRH